MNEISLLKQLVRIPTYEEKGMKRCSAFLKSKLKKLGFKVEIDKLNNVFAVKKYGKSANFLINAHFDTVSPGDGWKTNPLKPVRRGSKIYGLGTSDDKGSVACILAALSKLKKCRFGKLYLLLSNYEDQNYHTPTRTWKGTEWFLKNNKVPAKLGLNIESSVWKDKYSVRIGCGGRLSFDVITKGKEVHSSAPAKGINAIHKMQEVIKKIQSLKKADLEVYGIRLHGEFSVNMISGGRAINIIPGECISVVERRIMPTENMKKIKTYFTNAMKKTGASIRVRTEQYPYLINPDHSLVLDVKKSMKRALGYTPRLCIEMGRTDSTYLDQLNHTKTVIIGPGNKGHIPNESIDINRMKEFARILVDFLGG